jgi:hypothetical protein
VQTALARVVVAARRRGIDNLEASTRRVLLRVFLDDKCAGVAAVVGSLRISRGGAGLIGGELRRAGTSFSSSKQAINDHCPDYHSAKLRLR